MSFDPNPYTSPVAQSIGQDTFGPPSLVETPDLVRRHGNRLLVWDGAVLPPRCIRTNAPLGPRDKIKTKKMVYTPPWIWAFIIFGLLPALLLSLVLQKRFTVTFGLSRKEVNRLRIRVILGLLAFVLGIFTIIAAATVAQDTPWQIHVTVAGIVVLFGGLICAATTSALTPTRMKNGWFILRGCSPAFLDSIGPA